MSSSEIAMGLEGSPIKGKLLFMFLSFISFCLFVVLRLRGNKGVPRKGVCSSVNMRV